MKPQRHSRDDDSHHSAWSIRYRFTSGIRAGDETRRPGTGPRRRSWLSLGTVRSGSEPGAATPDRPTVHGRVVRILKTTAAPIFCEGPQSAIRTHAAPQAVTERCSGLLLSLREVVARLCGLWSRLRRLGGPYGVHLPKSQGFGAEFCGYLAPAPSRSGRSICYLYPKTPPKPLTHSEQASSTAHLLVKFFSIRSEGLNLP